MLKAFTVVSLQKVQFPFVTQTLSQSCAYVIIAKEEKDKPWTEEELAALAKGVAKFPGGVSRRYGPYLGN